MPRLWRAEKIACSMPYVCQRYCKLETHFLVHRLTHFLKDIKDQWAQAAIEKQKADAAATRH